jgi:hypothetical protein
MFIFMLSFSPGLVSAQAPVKNMPEAEVCNSSYKPDLAIVPPSCGTRRSAKVIIFSDDNHFGLGTKRIQETAMELSQREQMYGFFEGSVYRPKTKGEVGLNFGVEDQLIYDYSSVQATRNLLYAAVTENFSGVNEEGVDVLSLFKKQLLQVVIRDLEVWNLLKADFKGKSLPLFEKIESAQKSVYSSSVVMFGYISIGKAEEIVSTESNESLFQLSSFWLSAANKIIEIEQRYKFIGLAPKKHVIGDGRDILFSKIVVDHFCEASAKEKVIWLNIGSGHVTRTACLLKNYLPAGTLIETRNSNYFPDIQAPNYNEIKIRQILADYKKKASEAGYTGEPIMQSWSGGFMLTADVRSLTSSELSTFRNILVKLGLTTKEGPFGKEFVFPDLNIQK